MERVEPFIKCVDYWNENIPKVKLQAYASMIREGQIRNASVRYYRLICVTIVSYYANQPHEWILQELRKRAGRLEAEA